jgi:acetyltransferase-like isoleucine patch superfamily enzyme
MLRLIKSVYNFVLLYLIRQRQFDNVRLRRYFKDKYDIDVGMYSYGCFDHWRMPGPLRIGRYCSFAGTVRLAPKNHSMSSLTTHPVLYQTVFGVVDQDDPPAPPLIVEDDVWVGHFAMILPNCKFIGRGAVIGAGAVVTRNVEPYTVMGGNPARKLRDRFSPEVIAAIEASRWWELDLAALRTLVRDRPDTVFNPSVENLGFESLTPARASKSSSAQTI